MNNIILFLLSTIDESLGPKNIEVITATFTSPFHTSSEGVAKCFPFIVSIFMAASPVPLISCIFKNVGFAYLPKNSLISCI